MKVVHCNDCGQDITEKIQVYVSEKRYERNKVYCQECNYRLGGQELPKRKESMV